MNIEGLVAGYTGPGGKTILPGRAVAKLDLRLVPNQTRKEAVSKLRAHLDKRGFTDVEANVSGGYDPTETAEDSRIIRAELATYKRAGIKATLNPRLAGSWPGATFTARAAVAAGRTFRIRPRLRRARTRRVLRGGVDQSQGRGHHRCGHGLRRHVPSDRDGELATGVDLPAASGEAHLVAVHVRLERLADHGDDLLASSRVDFP